MRFLIALPFYLLGAIVWIVAGGFLILADKIGGTCYAKQLIG